MKNSLKEEMFRSTLNLFTHTPSERSTVQYCTVQYSTAPAAVLVLGVSRSVLATEHCLSGKCNSIVLREGLKN